MVVNSQQQATGQMVQTPMPKAKSVAKKGQDVLATMGLAATVPSSSTSCPLQVPSLPLSGLQEPPTWRIIPVSK